LGRCCFRELGEPKYSELELVFWDLGKVEDLVEIATFSARASKALSH
jgi:hypothetical protein